MSATPLPIGSPGMVRRSGRSALPAWMREPLLHFLLLGAVLFGIDHVVASREGDPNLIVVDEVVDRHARDLFRKARGREPNEDELYAMRRVWVDNEVLYREGLALQMDKGDEAIRDRVIFKALSVISAGLKLPASDERTLRAWFDRNCTQYDQSARYDFQEAVLVGDTSESAARAFAARLNTEPAGGVQASLRVFTGQPHPNIVQSYGDAFAEALEKLPPGGWHALEANGAWRVMRLESVTPATEATFESLRGVVLPDWTDEVMAEQRTAAVRALARKYTIQTRPIAQ